MKKILVVDSDIATLSQCQKNLTNVGYEVFSAPDGMAALEVVFNNRIDLVMADLNKTFMGGMDLLELISRNPRNNHIIKTLMTTLDATEPHLTSGHPIVSTYFLKPLDIKVVVEKLHVLLGEKSPEVELNF